MLLIHVLLALPFVLTLSLPAPPIARAGATVFASAAEPEMTVVFFDEVAQAENAAPQPPAFASRGVSPRDLPLVVLSPDPFPATANAQTGDSIDAYEETTSPEVVEHARLHGRYVTQVQARIERAWMRPRSGIGAPRFSCRASIRQDHQGTVIEVALDHCNGTERWQHSLVSAIRTASPLPAPPDASVYADVLWLSFASDAFDPEGSAVGFVPEAPRLAGTSAMESFVRFAGGLGGSVTLGEKEGGRVIHLTIIGRPAAHPAASEVPGSAPAASSDSQPPEFRPQ